MIIDKIMGRIAWGSNIIGAMAILTMLVVTTADVLMNKVFNWPFPGTTEVVTSVMPISVFAFLLGAQIQKRHISIDVVVSQVGSRARTGLSFLALSIGIFLFGLLTWLNVPLAIHSVAIGEHTGGNVAVPMYPAKIMIPLATGLITIQFLWEMVKGFRKLLSDTDSETNPIES